MAILEGALMLIQPKNKIEFPKTSQIGQSAQRQDPLEYLDFTVSTLIK